MFGKVKVEYDLMQKAPIVRGSERKLGAKVVAVVLEAIYPYIIESKDVCRMLANDELSDAVEYAIGSFQRSNGIVLLSKRDGQPEECKTISLISRLYEKIDELKNENEELRILIKKSV